MSSDYELYAWKARAWIFCNYDAVLAAAPVAAVPVLLPVAEIRQYPPIDERN